MAVSIADVKNKHESELLALPGAISVGVGLGRDGLPAIIVGVKSSDSQAAVKGPSELEGFVVEYKETGEIGGYPSPPKLSFDSYRWRIPPYSLSFQF